MIVKCIDNTGKKLPSQLCIFRGWNKNMEFKEVTIGKKYVVYAILHVNDIPSYLICSDIYDGEYVTFPSLLPSCLFEIVQNQHSQYWHIKNNSKDVGFKEILNHKYFYGNLVEGHEKEVKTFLHKKKLIDKENLTSSLQ